MSEAAARHEPGKVYLYVSYLQETASSLKYLYDSFCTEEVKEKESLSTQDY